MSLIIQVQELKNSLNKDLRLLKKKPLLGFWWCYVETRTVLEPFFHNFCVIYFHFSSAEFTQTGTNLNVVKISSTHYIITMNQWKNTAKYSQVNILFTK